MNHLDHAAQILDHLRTMLETELVQARGQRLLIRALDTQGLFERARQRSAFNAQLAQLERPRPPAWPLRLHPPLRARRRANLPTPCRRP